MENDLGQIKTYVKPPESTSFDEIFHLKYPFKKERQEDECLVEKSDRPINGRPS